MLQNILNLAYKPVRAGLFQLDAELAHEATILSLKNLSKLPVISQNPPCWAKNNGQKLFGLDFINPIGLAAGLDKNAECLPAWQAMGFGFIEVGTVTAIPQTGNPKPRLFRLKEHEALFNRMGFNNIGAEKVGIKILKLKEKNKIQIPIGINIGKSKVVDLQDAPQDYLKSYNFIKDAADYLVINISSPNTKNLRKLQNREDLIRILEPINSINQKYKLPIFLKLAPDMSFESACECAEVACDLKLTGLVLSNTSVDYSGLDISNNLAKKLKIGGGLSGKPIFERSTEMLRKIKIEFTDRLKIIGVGGILNTPSAKEKFRAGADLIQIYSGLVYNGPGFVRDLIEGI